MPTRGEEERELRRVDSHRQGAISIHLYTKQGHDYWRLVRETARGPVEFAAGHGSEIGGMKKLFERAENVFKVSQEVSKRTSWWNTLRTPFSMLIEKGKALWHDEAKKPREPVAKKELHYCLVRLSELTETGGAGGIVTSFTDLDKARQFRDKSPQLALYPYPLAYEPKKGDRFEISNREVEALRAKGEGKDFAHQFEFLRWKADQGKHFQQGLWNDRSEPPRLNQLVHFNSGRDHLNRPIDRLVSPLGRYDPGQPPDPQHVVYEVSSRSGIGRVVALPGTLEDAKTISKELNQRQAARDYDRSEEAWRELRVGSTLRGVADYEMRTPTIRPAELAREFDVDSPRLKVRTHVRGDFLADVIERDGEDGKPELSVVLTHRYVDRDGARRSAGAVFSFDELMSHRNPVPVIREQLRGRTNEVIEVTRAGQDGSNPTPPIEHKPHAQGAIVPPSPSYRLEFPSLNPDPPTNGAQGNRHWIAGEWWGVAPPKEGKFAYFTQGKSQISERMMIPGELNAKVGDPGERPFYVLGRIVAKNLIEIVGATRNVDYVVKHETLREQREIENEERKNQTALNRRGGRDAMQERDSIVSKPKPLEPLKPSPISNGPGRPHENDIAR